MISPAAARGILAGGLGDRLGQLVGDGEARRAGRVPPRPLNLGGTAGPGRRGRRRGGGEGQGAGRGDDDGLGSAEFSFPVP